MTAIRTLIAWVYERTGSRPLAQLPHASYTGSLVVLDLTRLIGTQSLRYEALLVMPSTRHACQPALRAQPT